MVCHSTSKHTHAYTYSCVTAYIKLRDANETPHSPVKDTVNAFTQNHHTSAQAFTCSLEKCVWLLPLSPALLKQLKAQLYNLLYSEDPVGHFRWALPVVLTTASRKKSRALHCYQGIILQHFTDFRQNSVYQNTNWGMWKRASQRRWNKTERTEASISIFRLYILF